MTPADREQLRLSLLRFLEANQSRFGLPTDYLWQAARAEGRTLLLRQDVEAELQYLKEKQLIAEIEKRLSPEIRAWRITAEGRDFWAQSHGA